MGKANDKKVVKQTRDAMLIAMGNLLESHRERRFKNPNGTEALSRKKFCATRGLVSSTVAHIETGRFLGLTMPQLRRYLATTHARSDAQFCSSVKTVYDGLKEIDVLLGML